jgi:hypothetical protein
LYFGDTKISRDFSLNKFGNQGNGNVNYSIRGTFGKSSDQFKLFSGQGIIRLKLNIIFWLRIYQMTNSTYSYLTSKHKIVTKKIYHWDANIS